MTLFEVYAGFSLTLAFGVPTFFEKVMRSGYESKVDSFRQSIMEEYRESLKEAVGVFEQAKELTDEIIEKMDGVTDAWVEVRSNCMKLDDLLKYRWWLFMGWMFSVAASICVIYIEDSGATPLDIGIEWVRLSHVAFWLMFVATIGYGWKIFEFDRELSKFSKTEKEEGIKLTSSTRFRSMEMIRNTESKVANALKENGIPFESGVKSGRLVYDIVIPNIKNPYFFVEIKYLPRPISFITFDRVGLRFIATKNKYPNSKTVLITNIKNLHPRVKGEINKCADKVFDLDNLQEFIKFVKEKME